jgi:heterodisulfide reductase subunit C
MDVRMTESQENQNVETNLAELDQGFAREVAEQPGGETVLRCLACGMCSAGCPVREVDDRYSPRKLIRMIHLGMRGEVLKSDFLWMCSNCFTCAERCPQGIKIPDMIRAVKNIAAKEGHLPANLKMVGESVGSLGRLYEIEEFDNKKRTKAGLPELATELPDVERLLKKARKND